MHTNEVLHGLWLACSVKCVGVLYTLYLELRTLNIQYDIVFKFAGKDNVCTKRGVLNKTH